MVLHGVFSAATRSDLATKKKKKIRLAGAIDDEVSTTTKKSTGILLYVHCALFNCVQVAGPRLHAT